MTEQHDPVDPQEYLRRLQESAATPQQPAAYPPPGYQRFAPPDHPSATTAMVLGIIGLASIAMLCGVGLVLSPVAWVMGSRALSQIDANPGQYGGRDRANAGRITGIIGTILLVVGLVALALFVIALIAAPGEIAPTDPYEYETPPYEDESGF